MMDVTIFEKRGRKYVQIYDWWKVGGDSEEHALGLARRGFKSGDVAVYRDRYGNIWAYRLEKFAGLPAVTRVPVPAAAKQSKQLQANAPQPAWLMPALIGGAIAAGLWLWSSSTKAATPTCPVDLKKFNDWLIAKELAGECSPELAVAPATYSDLQKLALAPGEFHPYVLVLGDGSFWYYSNYGAKAERSENLKNQYQTYAGGTLKGHPADLFMVA